jgi:large subunit ribosomal protein L43
MDGITGKWSLQKLRIRYSETGGSSLGMRFYMRYLLKDFKERNPWVDVETEHSLYQHPKVTAVYANGEQAECHLRNLTPKQIEDVFTLYRNSHGHNLHLRHGGPRCWTETRSIQGLWQPSLEIALKQVSWLHIDRSKVDSLRYSGASLRLAREAERGLGRWGNETLSPKGFDRTVLRRILRK